MTDFFISYTSADERWAEWIGYVLEEEGCSVRVQAWDFRPGSNFVLEMQQAASSAERTLMVLSPDYLKSQFANPEWAAAFAMDPQGLQRALVPVMVRSCEPAGMLKPLVHINVVGLAEDEARRRLVIGIRAGRAKPSTRPPFPGAPTNPATKAFPGASSETAITPMTYAPRIRGAPSDADKRRFLKQAFETIRAYFQRALQELAQRVDGADHDLEMVSATEFSVEIFLRGKSAARCRIWEGGPFGDGGIAFAEGQGHIGRDSYNEILTVDHDGGDLVLSAMMGGFGFTRGLDHLDLKRLRIEQAAEYLWRRLVGRLEE